MPSYETLCVLHPELPETRIKELTAWMQKILESAQGTGLRVDEWGTRDLLFVYGSSGEDLMCAWSTTPRPQPLRNWNVTCD